MLSLAFRPFPKDNGLLSVYDGDQIAPEPAWFHYTKQQGYQSAGVWSVTVAEAEACQLPARPDPKPNSPQHALIDFTSHAKKQQEAKSKILAAKAEARGCQFAPPAT